MEQSSQLVQLVSKDFPEMDSKDIELERLLELIKRFASVSQESELRIALKKLYMKKFRERKCYLVTRFNYGKKCFIEVQKKWDGRTLFEKASQPLLESGQITANYPEAMIGKVRRIWTFH